jgi:hypothetical protein
LEEKRGEVEEEDESEDIIEMLGIAQKNLELASLEAKSILDKMSNPELIQHANQKTDAARLVVEKAENAMTASQRMMEPDIYGIHIGTAEAKFTSAWIALTKALCQFNTMFPSTCASASASYSSHEEDCEEKIGFSNEELQWVLEYNNEKKISRNAAFSTPKSTFSPPPIFFREVENEEEDDDMIFDELEECSDYESDDDENNG